MKKFDRALAVLGGVALCLGLSIGSAPAAAGASSQDHNRVLVVAPVGDTSCGETTPYHTIQSAVTAASAGDEVFVCPSVYPERVVIDNSGHSRDNLQLEGAGVGDTFVQFPTTPPTNTDGDAIILINGTTGVDIHNLTARGPWSDTTGCSPITHYGIFVEGGGSADIHDNHISFIQDANQAALGGCQDGLAVRFGKYYADQSASGSVVDNVIDNYQKNGVTIDGKGTSALVADNVILGDTVDRNGINPFIARNGVQFGRKATGRIVDNFIAKNEYGGGGPPPAGENPDYNDAAGILVFETTGLRVARNYLNRNDIGFDFGYGPPGTEEPCMLPDTCAQLPPTTDLLIEQNVARDNRFNGLRAEADAQGNLIVDNTAFGTAAGHDCRDDSTGSGTAGTANTWNHDEGQTSMPAGICRAGDDSGQR